MFRPGTGSGSRGFEPRFRLVRPALVVGWVFDSDASSMCKRLQTEANTCRYQRTPSKFESFGREFYWISWGNWFTSIYFYHRHNIQNPGEHHILFHADANHAPMRLCVCFTMPASDKVDDYYYSAKFLPFRVIQLHSFLVIPSQAFRFFELRFYFCFLPINNSSSISMKNVTGVSWTRHAIGCPHVSIFDGL